jgi:hypothetical protein
MSACNVDKFVLPSMLTFFLMWHGKSVLSRQQKGDFADVVVTFSLPQKQKS